MPGSKGRHAAADHESLPLGQIGKVATHRPNVLHVLGCRIIALAALVVLGVLLAHYPPGALWAAPALAVYAVLLWRKPALWLLVVPALLPVLDFSAWTGWFYVREIDFLVLATLAVGYWKMVPQYPARAVHPAAALLLVLLASSYALSAALGFGSPQPIGVNTFAIYQSPFNSVRILLGFAWAILLLPLLTRSLGNDQATRYQHFFPGITLGLGLAALVTLWERFAFPGLLDFASDYRVTGSFSEMHVGGAALDGYLMLTLPFAAVWALSSRNPRVIAAASLAFALGTYATLVTFSRSTYIAYGLVMAIVLVGFLMVSRHQHGLGKVRWIAASLVFLLLGYVMLRVFASGGYRTLVAAAGLFAAAYFVGAVALGARSRMAVAVSALLLCGVMIAIMAAWQRTIYLSYAAALVLLGTGLVNFCFDRERKRGVAMVLTSLPLLALGTVLIAWHWGGDAAVPDALIAVVIALCLAGYNRYTAKPLWTLSRENMIVTALVVAALAMIIPVAGNYRMHERFTQVNTDLATRTAHWRDGLGMIAPGWIAEIFGMGLGSYPQHYFWDNRTGEIPGVQTYLNENGNTFLRLGGPRATIGNGELLSVFQMISVDPGRTYTLSFDLRSNTKDTILLADLCEKWLLYPVACAAWQGLTGTKVDKAEWTHFEKVIRTAGLGQWYWFGKRPMHFWLGVEKANAYVEVDNVALVDDAGRNLIKNGDFSDANDWWYFSSDKHHLPWHAKNIMIHVLFEQGWVGVVLVSLLLMYALGKFARRVLRRDFFAVAPLAALAGFLVVGMFDSLLDFPRLTLMFYLLLFLALIPAQSRVVSARTAGAPSRN